MWARKRIDIGWRDLLAVAGYALFPGSRATAQQSAEQTWPGSDDVIACLSVRSGLDLICSMTVGSPAIHISTSRSTRLISSQLKVL